MRLWLFALTLTFSTFAVVVVIASGFVSWLAPAASRRLERHSPASRAAMLFRLRMLPAALAAVIAAGITLPIYLAYEPRDSDEALARTLMLLGVAGASLMIRSGSRVIAAWRATRRVRREWQGRGRRIEGFDTTLPLFAIDEPFPTVAVIGVSRPALFISERVLGACTREEVGAMLRHEAAHVTVKDNLKRFLIRACPDLLRRGSELDRAWARAAEEAADAAAVAHLPSSAVALAEALIRVARLAPPRNTPELASAFYLGGSIESRVRRLVSPHPAPEAPTPFGSVMLIGGTLCLAAAVLAAAPALHQGMELLVSRLP